MIHRVARERLLLAAAILWCCVLGEIGSLWALVSKPNAFNLGLTLISLCLAGWALITQFLERLEREYPLPEQPNRG